MSPNRKGDQSLGYKKAEVIKYHQLHHFYCGETIFKIVAMYATSRHEALWQRALTQFFQSSIFLAILICNFAPTVMYPERILYLNTVVVVFFE